MNDNRLYQWSHIITRNYRWCQWSHQSTTQLQSDYMSKLRTIMKHIYCKYKNATYISKGDMNVTHINWINEILQPTQMGTTNDIQNGSVFHKILNELGLSQCCLDFTCLASYKILNLMLASRPATILEVQLLPEVSDHNIGLATLKLIVMRNKIWQRKIYKYDKADWDQINNATKRLMANYFEYNPGQCSLEENSAYVDTGIEAILDRDIPSKM